MAEEDRRLLPECGQILMSLCKLILQQPLVFNFPEIEISVNFKSNFNEHLNEL